MTKKSPWFAWKQGYNLVALTMPKMKIILKAYHPWDYYRPHQCQFILQANQFACCIKELEVWCLLNISKDVEHQAFQK